MPAEEFCYWEMGVLICITVDIPDDFDIPPFSPPPPPDPPLEGESDPEATITLPDGTVISATGLLPPLEGAKQICWQRRPWRVLWCVRADGVLMGLTYNKTEDVWGWHRVNMANGVVLSACVIPSATLPQDELWVVVQRTIGEETRNYIERMTRRIDVNNRLVPSMSDKAAYNFLDSSLSYSGAPATVFSGLGHLEGQTVRAWADGADGGYHVVTDGAITLAEAASIVHAGLHTDAVLVSLPPARLATDRLTVSSMILRFANTLGGKAGMHGALEQLLFRSTSHDMDASPPLWNGDMQVTIGGGHDDAGRYIVIQDTPGPMTLLAAFPVYSHAKN